MIISNLPIDDDIAKKIIYKDDNGSTIVVDARDIATTNYVDDVVDSIATLIDSAGRNINPNLLDNWYFLNPINRNGFTEANTGIMTVDRWRFKIVLGGAGTVSLLEDGLKLQGTDNGVAIIQNFTNSLPAGIYTVSILADVTGDESYVDFNEQIFINNGLTTSTITVDEDSISNIRVIASNDNIVNIKAIKLELGSEQTLAHQDENGNWVLNEIPNYADEMAKCVQYDVFTDKYIGLDCLPLDGSKSMTGENLWLNNKHGLVYSNTDKALLESLSNTDNTDNCRGISVLNLNSNEELSDALRFYERKDGILTRYNIYGEHSKGLDIKTYTSLAALGLTVDSFAGMDTPTAIDTLVSAMASGSIYMTGLTITECGRLGSALISKINTDCHMTYDDTSCQFTLKVEKLQGEYVPSVIEVIVDGDHNRYECIREYDGETLQITKFARTYAPLGVSSSIPLSNLDLNEVGIHTGYEGVYYGTANNNCTNFPPAFTKSVAFSLVIERGGGDAYWYTQTYTGTQTGRTFRRSRSGENRWTEWEELSVSGKSAGTYTGTGNTTSRTISVGGSSNVLIISSTNGVAIVTPGGAIIKSASGTSTSGLASSAINFANGVLTIASSNANVNASSVEYSYKVV